MGYWFPPSPKAFEPVARPLGYFIQNGIYVPDALDLPLLSVIGQTALGKSIGAGKAYDLILRMRPPPDAGGSYATEENIGGIGSQSVVMRRWMSGDLPDGGLPPDSVNRDGSITCHYWDLSDGTYPRRKCITRGGTEKGEAWQRVMQWNPDKGWEEEGGDAERELVIHFNEIFTVITILVRMVASAMGIGAPAAAIMGLMFDGWKLASSQFQINGWDPPTKPLNAGDVFAQLGGDFIGLAAAVGQTDAFGKLAAEAQRTFTSLMVSAGAYPMIKGLGELGGSVISSAEHAEKFLLGIGNVTGDKAPTLRFDPGEILNYTGQLLSGKSPNQVAITVKDQVSGDSQSDPTTLPVIDYRRSAWDNACVGYTYPGDVLRIRRNYIWSYRLRSTPLSPSEMSVQARGISESEETALECGMAFDSYLSQMYANQRAPKRSLFSASEATDWSATASYRQVLARGKQSAAVASDPGATRSFKQWADAHPLAKTPPSTTSDPSADAIGAAALILVLYKLFRR